MSTKIVEGEIKRFLAGSDAEVLCIKGKWGVGKTFAWMQYLREAEKHDRLSLTKYAYVSLFGLNDLEALRYAIFESTVETGQF
jgi:Cdc6-like AAA superfamily ATPase